MAKNKLDAALRGLIGASKVKNQKDFGDKLGYNKSYVSELINDAQPITDAVKERMRTIFGISKQWWDLPLPAPIEYEATSKKIHALAQTTGEPHGQNKDTAGLKAYLKEDKIERLESKWKSLLAGLMLGKQETKTMQELDDIIQELKEDNDKREDEINNKGV